MQILKIIHLSVLWVGLALLIGIQPTSARPNAASNYSTAIDAYITEQMQALKIPGVALAIVQGNQVVYQQGYGVADSTGRTVTPQTPFLLASVSKSFTGLAIMQLAESGQLNLDMPVQHYLPWFRVADAEASAQITLRHLLYHKSGFSEVEGYKRNLDNNLTDEALGLSIRRLSNATLNNPPGSVYEYSNTNYDVLGLIVQTVTGQTYEAYIQQHIFEPLEMKNSFTSLADARANGVSSSYYPFFGFPMVYDAFILYARVVVPSAGLFASAEDMGHYLIAHLNEGRYADQQIVSPAGMAEIHTPGVKLDGTVGYAMGWLIFPFSDIVPEGTPDDAIPRGHSHAGVWAGFTSLVVLIPERDLGVVVLMNSHDSSQSSQFFNLGWNSTILALGQNPPNRPPQEDVLTQNIRLIGLGMLALLVGINLWQVRHLPRWREQWQSPDARRWRILAVILIPLIIELALGGYVSLVRMPEAKTTLPLTLRFEPDLGLLGLATLGLTLGWAPLRAGWALWRLKG